MTGEEAMLLQFCLDYLDRNGLVRHEDVKQLQRLVKKDVSVPPYIEQVRAAHLVYKYLPELDGSGFDLSQLPDLVNAQDAEIPWGQSTYRRIKKRMPDYKMQRSEDGRRFELYFPKTVEDIRHALKRLPTKERAFVTKPVPHWVIMHPLSKMAVGVLRHLLDLYPWQIEEEIKQKVLAKEYVPFDRIPKSPEEVGKRIDYDGENNMVVVRFPFDGDLVKKCGAAGGQFAESSFWGKYWWFSGDALETATLVSELVGKYNFALSPAAEDHFQELFAERQQNLDQSRAIDDVTEDEFDAAAGRFEVLLSPRPYQQTGVSYLLRNKRAILGDSMGLGKTMQALLTANKHGAFPMLILCKASLKTNLYMETVKTLKGVKVHVSHGYGDELMPTDAHVYIANFAILAARRNRHSSLSNKIGNGIYLTRTGASLNARNFKTIAVDEAQALKNRKSIRHRAVAYILKNAQRRNDVHFIPMTGGAAENSPAEFMGIMEMTGALEALGGFFHVSKEYFAGHKGYHGGWEVYDWQSRISAALRQGEDQAEKVIRQRNRKLSEFNENMRAGGWYLRRTTKQVFSEMGEESPFVPVWMDMSGDAWEKYQKEEQKFVDWISKFDSPAAAFALKPNELIGLYGRLWQLTSTGKIFFMKDYLHTHFMESGTKCVVFNYHVDAQLELRTHFKDQLSLYSPHRFGSPEKDKEAFQDPESDHTLLFASLMADHTGHTLTEAWHHVYGSVFWNPMVMAQAIARSAWRTNNPHPAQGFCILARHTVDEDLWFTSQLKQPGVMAALDGEEPDDVSIEEEIQNRQSYTRLITKLMDRVRSK